MASKKLLSIGDELRKLIRDSGLSHSKISAESDVSQSIISRFMSKHRTITVETADRLRNAVNSLLAPKQ